LPGVSLRVAMAVVLAMNVSTLTVTAVAAAGTGLMVQINPEAHLDTPVASVSFNVVNPGQLAYSQPITVTSWVRALPNQQIQLTAQPVALAGPNGAASTATIQWTGTMASATGGATTANCTSGNFGTGGAQQMIGNWSQSGIAKCTITFALATDASWPAGTYSGSINLSLSAQ